MLLHVLELDALVAMLARAVQLRALLLVIKELGAVNDISAVWAFDLRLLTLKKVLLGIIQGDELAAALQRAVGRLPQASLNVRLILRVLHRSSAHRTVFSGAYDGEIVPILVENLEHLLRDLFGLARGADRLPAHLRLPAVEAGPASHRCFAVAAH